MPSKSPHNLQSAAPQCISLILKSSVISVSGLYHFKSFIRVFKGVCSVFLNSTPKRFRENLFHALADLRSIVSPNLLILRVLGLSSCFFSSFRAIELIKRTRKLLTVFVEFDLFWFDYDRLFKVILGLRAF